MKYKGIAVTNYTLNYIHESISIDITKNQFVNYVHQIPNILTQSLLQIQIQMLNSYSNIVHKQACCPVLGTWSDKMFLRNNIYGHYLCFKKPTIQIAIHLKWAFEESTATVKY